MKTIKELEEECRAILKPYGLKLPKPWRGFKPVWHSWHEPRPMYFLTYRGYLERVIEIHKNKSEDERPIRFAAMKPVHADLSQLPKYAAWKKAYAAWKKAYAEREKTYAEWQKAYAEWEKTRAGWQKALAEFMQENRAAFIILEAKECPGSTWDWEQNKMTFRGKP